MPTQAVSRKQKNKKWQEESVDAVISRSAFAYVGPRDRNWRDIVAACYEYYNGVVADEDYHHVLRPYGKARKNMPAKLRNYNILKPTVDVLIGEYAKRPDNWTVAVSNPDVNTVKEMEKKKVVTENLREHLIQELQNMGFDLGSQDPQAPPMLPEDIEAEFEREYTDARAIQGQNALQYCEYNLEIPRNFRKGFFDFTTAGLVYSLKEVVGDEIRYEIVNPLHVDSARSPDVDFVEDDDWAVIRKLMLPSQIIDQFWEDLTPEQIKRLEKPRTGWDEPLFTGGYEGRDDDGRLVEVYRVFWKSVKKIGILHYFDPNTESWEMARVDEGHKKREGQRVDWYWVNEVWEGTRIDRDIYLRIQPVPVQRGSLDNPSVCKLPVNGRIYSDRNAPFTSVIQLGIPYQLIYNVYKYRLEMEVAKAKGMIAQLDLDYIPDGWDMDKYMYYIDATGIAWQQRQKSGEMPNHTHREVLDLTVKAIQEYVALLEFTLAEWETVSGVTRQRKGSMTQYDGKGTSEQSIIQSSHITEDLFQKYEDFKQRERAGILDLSRIAFVKGKKGMFVLNDGAQGWLDIDGLQHMESEYGVFVTSSGKEQQKIAFMKALGQQMVQAGWQPSTLAEIMETENYSGLKEKLRKAEEAQARLQEAQSRMEAEQAQALQQAEQMRIEHEARENELDRMNRIEIAQIQAQSGMEGTDSDPAFDRLKFESERRLKEQELNQKGKIENRKLDLQKQKQDKDAELKAREITIKRIAANKKPTTSSK